MKAVICGGGTGGHIYPALSIADYLRARGADILYMGCASSAESRLAAANGFAFRAVEAAGLRRRSPLILKDLARNYRGFRQAGRIIAEFAPDLVIGTGGYGEAPVVKAAQQLKIPTLLHEQNAFPGLANRYLAQKAQAICLTFAEAGAALPHPERQHVTGLPIRQSILTVTRAEARGFFHLPEQDQAPCLLITGGSAGAASLNRAAEAAWPKLLEAGYRIIHLCGRENHFQLRQRAPQDERLILLPYLDEMAYALALADLAVARAGAGFLAEAAARGLPLVLVPYPYAANDHQRYNAQAFAAKGAGVVIDDQALNGPLLAETVLSLLRDREGLSRMSEQAQTLAMPDALARIGRVIDGLLAGPPGLGR